MGSVNRCGAPPTTEGTATAGFVEIEITRIDEVGREFEERTDGGISIGINCVIERDEFARVAAGRQAPTRWAKVSRNIAGSQSIVAVTSRGSVPVVHDTVTIPRIINRISIVCRGEGAVDVVSVKVNVIDAIAIVCITHGIGSGGRGAVRNERGSRQVGIGVTENVIIKIEAKIFDHPAMIIGEFGDGISVAIANICES